MTRLFDTTSTDFAGARSATSRGIKLLLICAEHLKGWRLAYRTSAATALEIIAFIKQHIIYSFGKRGLIISDNGLCFTASLLEKILSKDDINLKTVMAYAPVLKGRTERIVRIFKGAIDEVVHCKPSD